MPIFSYDSNLSSFDLQLNLHDNDGLPRDAFKVSYTIFSSLSAVSGKNLPSLKKGTGRYYAPWCTKVKNGNYKIVWYVEVDSGSEITNYEEKFFVIEQSAYQCSPGYVCDNGKVSPGGLVYLHGSTLTRVDLPIFFKDASGFAVDPFSILWSIYSISGCVITTPVAATKSVKGEYYAKWYVATLSGDYYVKWDWIDKPGGVTSSNKLMFSVINPPVIVVTNNGSSSMVSEISCSK